MRPQAVASATLSVLPDACSFSEDGRSFLVGTRQSGLQGRGLVQSACFQPLALRTSEAEREGQPLPPATSLWSRALPVEAVAQAGGSSLVALLLGGAVATTTPVIERRKDEGTPVEPYEVTRLPFDSGAQLFHNPAAFTSGGSRRYVYLFDLQSGHFLAELYFRGAVILGIRANRALLVVMLADAFHVVALDTLQHVRQQAMYTPLNPHCILALSPLVEVVPHPTAAAMSCEGNEESPTRAGAGALPGPQESSRRRHGGHTLLGHTRIAFPQSSKNSRKGNGVLIVTLTRSLAVPAVSEEGKESPSPSLPTEEGKEVFMQSQLLIPAHGSALTALALSGERCGLLLTASRSGNCLRLFDAENGVLLHEFAYGGGTRVKHVALSCNQEVVAALLDNDTIAVFDSARVVRLWRAARQRNWLVGDDTEGGAQRGGWSAVAWATAKIQAVTAGFFSNAADTTAPSLTGKTDASVMSASRSNPFTWLSVRPLFSVQDFFPDGHGQDGTFPTEAVATSTHLAFGADHATLWVGQYGIAATSVEERCILQSFNVQCRGRAPDVRQSHALEHTEILL